MTMKTVTEVKWKVAADRVDALGLKLKGTSRRRVDK